MNREEIAQGCLDQAGWAAKLGSPMYEALLRRMADDVRDGGMCLVALEPHMPRSRMLAPLLLLAAIHRMVLKGQLPEAARFYPSMGGQADVNGLWPYLLKAIPHAVPPVCIQTNEVERSRALLPGFLEVVRRTGLPLRLLEIGASAGLNLRWDHYRYEVGADGWGDPASPVRLAGAFTGPHPRFDGTCPVVERRGCDMAPLDPGSAEDRLTLRSYVWADQTERLRLLDAALTVAQGV